jgi:hypothetical protein
VLAVGGLPMGFLGQWCRTVAEVVGEVHTSMVGIGGVVFGYVEEVGGWWLLVMRLLQWRLLTLLY